MDAPAVAVSRDGKTIAAAWMDMRAGRNDRNVYWTITKGGRFAPETPVHDVTTGLQGHPSLAIDGDGVVWCAWEDARTGPNRQQVYAASSKDRKNIPVSEPSEGKGKFPVVAAGGGIVGVAYEAGSGCAFRLLKE